jgi:uncharacterized RDD family membrane protein YckC
MLYFKPNNLLMNNEINLQETSQDIFTEQDLLHYESASVGQRFLNYLIDAIVMQYGLSFITGFILGAIINAISPQTAYDLFVVKKDNTDVLLSFYLITILNFLIYYTICETAFKGKTLGKLITGTKAIKDDGTELSFKDALMRSLSRIVPFEAFSAFGGYPWHDRWTKTIVIKKR